MRLLLVLVSGFATFTLLCACGPSSGSAPPPSSANGASTAAPASTGCSCQNGQGANATK